MSTPSALEAIRIGRQMVPEYVSGNLVRLETRKGKPCWYEHEIGWVRDAPVENEDGDFFLKLPTDFEPVIGAACLLGAQGLAMGVDLTELQEGDAFYVHPDFIIDPLVRENNPAGYVANTSIITGVAYAEFPCSHPLGDPDFIGSAYVGQRAIPEIIAHLNDYHDPRHLANSDTTTKGERDQWTEARIIEWLRGLGYNGETE